MKKNNFFRNFSEKSPKNPKKGGTPPPRCITSTPKTVWVSVFDKNRPQNTRLKPSPDCTPPKIDQGSLEKTRFFRPRESEKCL